MLQRLFRNKSAQRDYDDNYTRALLEPEEWHPPILDDEQLRVLLCQDAGEANKTILYDSTASLGQQFAQEEMARSWNGSQHMAAAMGGRAGIVLGSLTERKGDWGPSSVRNSSFHDSNRSFHPRQGSRRLDLIGDMIFGTAPLAYKGMSTKVHYTKRDKDPQIVLSKLFTFNPRDIDVTRRTSFSSINSDWSIASSSAGVYGEDHAMNSTSSVSTRSVSMEGNASEQSSDDDKSRSSTSSIYPPVLGLRSSSRRSFHSKRSRRFSQTSMENGMFRPTPLPTTPTMESPDSSEPTRHSSRTIKYAVAIVITLEDKNKTLYDFIFSHFALIENHIHQLLAAASRVLCSRNNSTDQVSDLFCAAKRTPSTDHTKMRKPRSHLPYLGPNALQSDPAIIEAVLRFKRAFYDLYGSPRIQEPLWLNMSTFPQRKSDYCKSFTDELIYLIDEYDNKSHNFLISSLITAVLSYHLSWVHTVAPPDEDKTIGCRHGNYDPLWAQLSDLYGYVGTPSRITRTIVVGQRPSIVRRILYILTYLIRCNEVYENFEAPSDPASDNIFSCERGMDDHYAAKLEDKIVRQLIGSSTDVESIAIPNTQHSLLSQDYRPTASPESLTDNSNPTSPTSTPFMHSHGQSQWSSMDSNHQEKMWRRSRDNPIEKASLNTHDVDVGLAAKLGSSASSVYRVEMPKSSIFRMVPDITQVKDTGIPTEAADRLYAKSYGRSLMAAYSDIYKSDFILMGVPNTLGLKQMESDMKSMLQQFALSDSVTDAACLVIDTNQWRSRVLHQYIVDGDMVQPQQRSNGLDPEIGVKRDKDWQPINHANIVREMLCNIRNMHSSGSSPEQMVDFFEDSLQLIYLKSTQLQEQVYEGLSSGVSFARPETLLNNVGIHESDFALLANVCSTFDPKISKVLLSYTSSCK